jgi:hypothetical protein
MAAAPCHAADIAAPELPLQQRVARRPQSK